MKIKIIDVNGRRIAIGNIGKLFYQEGFPISMSIFKLKEQNIETSLYHVADECLKNGWSPATVYKKMVNDLEGEGIDKEELHTFCFAEYEKQRELIFNYLFDSEEDGFNYFKNKLK